MKAEITKTQKKQDDEEKAVLFEAIEKFDLDIDNLVIAKNMLLAELKFYSPSAEKLKTLIIDIELWTGELADRRMTELNEARKTFLKNRAVNRL
ncbi:hypothetical protein LCGC14_1301420 [marine sediment metagenome]|uniref:Uncharacterized protein n=1 Tax=marine sediment metagenome TaxID=412755 RepID=A0A0F9KPT5_9ZZZZ